MDLRRGTSGAGPHLDDVRIRGDERDLRHFGSTGEQRSALLAWTLAEHDCLRESTGTAPLVLLDEPYAELDASRCERLDQLLTSLDQVLLTSTTGASPTLREHAGERTQESQLLVPKGEITLWTTD